MHSQTESQRKANIKILVLGYLLLFASITFFVIILNRTIDVRIDADDASELLLSSLLAKERKLISANWYYSTELRILNTQIVFSPLFLFLDNWHAVRVIGTAINLLILVFSSLFLCFQMGMRKEAPFVAAILCIPISWQYYRFVIERSYYIPHIAANFVLLGLLLRFLFKKSQRGKGTGIILAAFTLSILQGLNGPRQIPIFYVPLFLTALGHYWRKPNNAGITDRTRYHLLFFASVVLAGALIGYVANSRILSRYYSFKTYQISFTPFRFERFLECLNGFLVCCGWEGSNTSAVTAIPNAVSIILVLFICFAAVQGIVSHRDSTADYFILSMVFILSYFGLCMLYAVTDMRYEIRYCLLPAALAIPLLGKAVNIFFQGKQSERSEKHLWKHETIVAAAGSVLIIITGVCRFSDLLASTPKSNQYIQAAQFCMDNNYLAAYSSFWNGNILTELSNGKVNAHVFAIKMENTQYVDDTCRWLQEVAHDNEIPEGKVCLVLTRDEKETYIWGENLREEDQIFTAGDMILYGYEDHEAMLKQLYSSLTYSFGDSRFCRNAEDKDGRRIVYSGGLSYGPYVFLPEGRYKISITGEGISQCSCYCTFDQGKSRFDAVDQHLESSDVGECISFEIETEGAHNFEVLMENDTEHDVVIDSIVITNLSKEGQKKGHLQDGDRK